MRQRLDRHAFGLRLQARRLRSDDASARQLRPRRRVERVIPMAVPREQQVHPRRPAERIHHARDGCDVWRERPARLRIAAAAAEERILRKTGDVAVGHDIERSDLVIHVRDRHPRDVDERRHRCERQLHCGDGAEEGDTHDAVHVFPQSGPCRSRLDCPLRRRGNGHSDRSGQI